MLETSQGKPGRAETGKRGNIQTWHLCDFGQVIQALCSSASSPVQHLLQGDVTCSAHASEPRCPASCPGVATYRATSGQWLNLSVPQTTLTLQSCFEDYTIQYT